LSTRNNVPTVINQTATIAHASTSIATYSKNVSNSIRRRKYKNGKGFDAVNGAKKTTIRPTNNSMNVPLPLIENHDQSVNEDRNDVSSTKDQSSSRDQNANYSDKEMNRGIAIENQSSNSNIQSNTDQNSALKSNTVLQINADHNANIPERR